MGLFKSKDGEDQVALIPNEVKGIFSWRESGEYKTMALFANFFAANYNMFVINPVLLMLSVIYGDNDTALESILSSSAIIGVVLGEISIGHVGDGRLGLNFAFILTMTLIILGSFLCGLFPLLLVMSAFRLIVGMGVGGTYPLCAALSTVEDEKSASYATGPHGVALVPRQPVDWRSKQTRTLTVFCAQGFSLVAVNLIAYVFVSSASVSLPMSWRAVIFLGGGLAIISLLLFLIVPKGDTASKTESSQTTGQIIKANWRMLLKTGGSWFVFDVVYYANSLFSAVVLEKVFNIGADDEEEGKSASAERDDLEKLLQSNVLLALIPLLGFAAAFLYFKYSTRSVKFLQIFGFVGMCATYLVLSLFYSPLAKMKLVFVAVYGLSFCFSNCGPNSTTFLFPTLVFPTDVKATCHGISAASGKVGAVLGSAIMAPLLAATGPSVVFLICAGLSLLGVCISFTLPNT